MEDGIDMALAVCIFLLATVSIRLSWGLWKVSERVSKLERGESQW